MKLHVVLGMCLAVALVGCVTGRTQHTIPIERDYSTLQKVKVEEATDVVSTAHRVGAGHFAPYEYQSAKHYLDWAEMEKAESDQRGEWDYSALAIKYGKEAIAKGSGIPDGGTLMMPDNLAACIVEHDRLVAKYRELDACRAQLVAPVPFAHVEANLSIAEHELLEKYHYEQAARWLRWVEADIDAILAKDWDGDGIKDMVDGDPWIPEDKDGYEDEDGIPEPKPYPKLSPVSFKTDSAKLTGEALGYLRGVANMLIDGYSEVTVYIEGHTDSDAPDEYNVDLSKRRADVVEQCLKANGAKNGMVTSSCKGEAAPVADNATAAGKAKNRRVEIWLDSPDVTTPYPCVCAK
jgi:outer membrane protein OmpA-like peptidoglycan-associated protein